MRVPSSIERTKAAMGYQCEIQRPCCHNCYHVRPAAHTGAYNDRWQWRCTKGGFGVAAKDCCNEHQPYQQEQGGAA